MIVDENAKVQVTLLRIGTSYEQLRQRNGIK